MVELIFLSFLPGLKIPTGIENQRVFLFISRFFKDLVCVIGVDAELYNRQCLLHGYFHQQQFRIRIGSDGKIRFIGDTQPIAAVQHNVVDGHVSFK